ncbi:MAG TPA: hypothetical protein VII56_12090 [Rhizomicrobium sp.]
MFVVEPPECPLPLPDITKPTPSATKPTPAIHTQSGARIAACFTPAGLPGARAAWSESDAAKAVVPLEKSNAEAKATAPKFRNMKNPPDQFDLVSA